MRKSITLITLASALIAMTGCMSSFYGTQYKYTYSLTETPNQIVLDSNSVMHFEDSVISVDFTIGQKQVAFAMKNKTQNTVKIIWDETLFIKFDNPGKVMHSGVKYNERNSSQPPSVIPGGTVHEDVIIPTDNIYWRDGYYSSGYSRPGGWEERDLFATQDLNKPDIKNAILASKGLEFRVFMPLQVNGVNKEYNFKFKILNVAPVVKTTTR